MLNIIQFKCNIDVRIKAFSFIGGNLLNPILKPTHYFLSLFVWFQDLVFQRKTLVKNIKSYQSEIVTFDTLCYCRNEFSLNLLAVLEPKVKQRKFRTYFTLLGKSFKHKKSLLKLNILVMVLFLFSTLLKSLFIFPPPPPVLQQSCKISWSHHHFLQSWSENIALIA